RQPAQGVQPPTADGLPDSIGSTRLRDAALAGDPTAAYEVAMRFLEGRGVPANLEEAARWYERAASKGLAPAQFRYASMLEKGQGVKRTSSPPKNSMPLPPPRVTPRLCTILPSFMLRVPTAGQTIPVRHYGSARLRSTGGWTANTISQYWPRAVSALRKTLPILTNGSRGPLPEAPTMP